MQTFDKFMIAGLGCGVIGLCCLANAFVYTYINPPNARPAPTEIVPGTTVFSTVTPGIITPTLSIETPTFFPTLTPGVPTEAGISTPVPNPNTGGSGPSGRIVFTCYVEQIDQICILNADGSGRKQLTHFSATTFYPSLSPDGKTIYQFERPVNVNLDEDQMKVAASQPFNLHDMFPLVAGTYRLSVLVKNDVSKEFTSFEQTLVIPGETPVLQMTSPILGYRAARTEAAKTSLKPFQVGPFQVSLQPSRIFTRKDTLVAAFQVFGLSEAQKASAELRFAFTKNDQPAGEKIRRLTDCPDLPAVLVEFRLADFVPAHYYPWKQHPSHRYVDPNKIYEYAHGGLLILCTSDFLEIRNNLNEHLITFDSYDQLIDVLKDLSTNLEELYKRRIAIFKYAREKLLWENYERNILNAYSAS